MIVLEHLSVHLNSVSLHDTQFTTEVEHIVSFPFIVLLWELYEIDFVIIASFDTIELQHYNSIRSKQWDRKV